MNKPPPKAKTRKRRRTEEKKQSEEKKHLEEKKQPMPFKVRVAQLNAKKKKSEMKTRICYNYPFVLATDWPAVVDQCLVKLLKKPWKFSDSFDADDLHLYDEMKDFLFVADDD